MGRYEHEIEPAVGGSPRRLARRSDGPDMARPLRAALAGRPDVLGPGGSLQLQRTVGNSATASLLGQTGRSPGLISSRDVSPRGVLQRCGSTSPDRCSCHDEGEPAGARVSERMTVQRACTPEGWEPEYDGCSLPARAAFRSGGLQVGGKTKDNPTEAPDTWFAHRKPTSQGGDVCDRHDECYQTCGSDRGRCDDRMYHDMKRVCAASKADAPTKQRCFTYAFLYWSGLRLLGAGAHGDRQAAVCGCEREHQEMLHVPVQAPLPSALRAARDRIDPDLISDWLIERARYEYEMSGPREEARRRRLYHHLREHPDQLPDAQLVAEVLGHRLVDAAAAQASNSRPNRIAIDLSTGFTVSKPEGPAGTVWTVITSCAGLDRRLQQLVAALAGALAPGRSSPPSVVFSFGSRDGTCRPVAVQVGD